MSKLEEAALAWNAARTRALELRRARNEHRCEFRSDGGEGEPYTPPCWWSHTPQAEWCDPCRSREVIQADYRLASVERSSCMRRLVRAARSQGTDAP